MQHDSEIDNRNESQPSELTRHGGDLGVRETLDIARVFADDHKPKVRVSASDESQTRRELVASGATR
jgi:hypothetical protein